MATNPPTTLKIKEATQERFNSFLAYLILNNISANQSLICRALITQTECTNELLSIVRQQKEKEKLARRDIFERKRDGIEELPETVNPYTTLNLDGDCIKKLKKLNKHCTDHGVSCKMPVLIRALVEQTKENVDFIGMIHAQIEKERISRSETRRSSSPFKIKLTSNRNDTTKRAD